MADLTDEIAASAAQWVVDEGLEYGPAKRRASIAWAPVLCSYLDLAAGPL